MNNFIFFVVGWEHALGVIGDEFKFNKPKKPFKNPKNPQKIQNIYIGSGYHARIQLLPRYMGLDKEAQAHHLGTHPLLGVLGMTRSTLLGMLFFFSITPRKSLSILYWSKTYCFE